jgi:hypothetical protein
VQISNERKQAKARMNSISIKHIPQQVTTALNYVKHSQPNPQEMKKKKKKNLNVMVFHIRKTKLIETGKSSTSFQHLLLKEAYQYISTRRNESSLRKKPWQNEHRSQ